MAVRAASDSIASSARDWVSFIDGSGDIWMFDASFLCSSWTCIYGQGCQGVLAEDATELGHGCCTHGAHFADADDLARVRETVERLGPDDWQFRPANRRTSPFTRQSDGTYLTKVVDGACIFLNRLDHPGGDGCALHAAALRAGERPMDWKPEVCWQLPLRLTSSTDENERTTYTLREWHRRDWGEGGLEFHWWCTEGPEAFVGHEPVYRALEHEIRALVGDERYEWFVAHVTSRPATQILPHPARRNRSREA